MICGGKTWAFKTWALVCGSLVLSAGVRAVTPDLGGNPYRGIVERNVFSLKDPPPPPKLAPPAAPPVKITLTGITTILGNKRALMRAQIPARPPEPAKEESYMLAEGQRDGDIEVLTIDEKAGTVKVSNHGVPETLDFANNGAKLVNAPPPIAAPALPPPMGIPMGVSAPPPNAMAAAAQRSLAGGLHRASANGVDPNGVAPGGPAGFGSTQSQPSANYQTYDPDTQKIMLEVERERTKEAVANGTMPPLPPTVLTPQDSPDFIPPGS
jgi:hypothetical protein